jgi:hypothetical protein
VFVVAFNPLANAPKYIDQLQSRTVLAIACLYLCEIDGFGGPVRPIPSTKKRNGENVGRSGCLGAMLARLRLGPLASRENGRGRED